MLCIIIFTRESVKDGNIANIFHSTGGYFLFCLLKKDKLTNH